MLAKQCEDGDARGGSGAIPTRTCTVALQGVTCEHGALQPDAVATVTVELSLLARGEVTITAEALMIADGVPGDGDGDGYTPADGDCDDGDPFCSPAAADVCNGFDDNCDGLVDEIGDLARRRRDDLRLPTGSGQELSTLS